MTETENAIENAIMEAYGDNYESRNRMERLAFPYSADARDENAESLLAAIQSYSASEPDYQAALSVFDDCMAGHGHDEIGQRAFRRLLKSCDGNPNAMSGFMHAAIEYDRATMYNEYLANAFAASTTGLGVILDFAYPNTKTMRLMLANLAEGYPIEYIIELIISEKEESEPKPAEQVSSSDVAASTLPE